MDHLTERLPKYLAQNVINLRQKQSLSQAQLAKIAGIPRSTITYIESGEGNPSLQNLSKVAAALQISIEEILSAPRPSCKLIPAKEVPVVKRGHGLAEIYKLLPDSIPGAEIDRMEISVGARMGGVPHVANTKEYLIGVQGQIQVHVAGDKHTVGPGDVLAFPGDEAHSYHNVGKAKAVCFSVVIMTPKGI